MRLLYLFASCSLLLAQPPAASNWRTATELEGVDLAAATPAQKQLVLKVLRDYDCTCGCGMKLAQCRVEDPKCAQSRTLGAMAATAARAGKNEGEIRKLLDESPFAKKAANRNRTLLDPVPLNLAGAPSRGPEKARVTLVEFSDFQCPVCIQVTPKLKAVLSLFPNDVRLVFKQFPLDSHSAARLAAAASIAAQEQGKFWEMHDKLYANARYITRTAVLNWAKEFSLDLPKFTATLDSPRTKTRIDREITEGLRAGVEGTPSLFVNGKQLQVNIEVDVLRQLIAQELQAR